MKINEEILQNFTLSYPLEQTAPLDRCLFVDIETTGFAPESSGLYLIGCACFENSSWRIRQWLAESYEEEQLILRQFLDFSKNYSVLLHFNGDSFDLPFLAKKCEQYGLPPISEETKSIDLYRRTAPYKFFLRLPACRQKTLERFLGLQREDTFNGGELIDLYHEYVKEPSELSRKTLLLHNADDIRGMLQILPILAYSDMFLAGVRAKRVQANHYKDAGGHLHSELLMTLELPFPLPVSISASANGCYFKGEAGTGSLKIPIYQEELKYFYSGYKDYYYLPMEDLALHKSVSSFVDREHRVPALASTCYTRKHSSYLPQWDMFMTPFFKRDYKSKELFFELTDELKTDREAFTLYANHVLHMIASTY